MTEQELHEKGWECFPWWWILSENLFMLVPWVIGFAVMWPLKVAGVPVASLGYALLILITVGWLLKVHNCSTCYYYDKWCHLGWGKYAALICKKDAGNPETGMKFMDCLEPLRGASHLQKVDSAFQSRSAGGSVPLQQSGTALPGC